MNTDISIYLTPRVIDNKVISLATKFTDANIKLFGSTMVTSIQPVDNYVELNQVTLYPEYGKDGIVALAIIYRQHEGKGHVNTSHIPAFLKLYWKENEGDKKVLYPFIDLDKPWIPTSRVGHVRDGGIEVRLQNGRRFCTENYPEWRRREDKNLPVYLTDGNLLCRYLWGTAHADDVLQAAVHQKLEPTAKELVEEMKEKTDIIKDEISVLRNQMKKAEPFYKLLKRLPACFLPESLRGFIEAMDGISRFKGLG